jgi:hypothetical protein
MQQIVHGLRTRGSMDSDEITRVVPWLNTAHDTGTTSTHHKSLVPHAFKTHTTLDQVPKGGRYVTIVRDQVHAGAQGSIRRPHHPHGPQRGDADAAGMDDWTR